MKMHQDKPVVLSDVIPYLMINYPFVPDIGLLNGKMGGVLLFNHYARYTDKTYYSDYADDLFASIYDSLTESTPIDFRDGLCGIGWGIEYLLQHGFSEGDSDEILEVIDSKIMERDVQRISDMSFETGLEGILLYVITRIESYDRRSKSTPFDQDYLHKLQIKINANIPTDDLSGLTERLNKIQAGSMDYTNKPMLADIISNPADVPDNFETIPLGIKNGLSGTILNMIIQS